MRKILKTVLVIGITIAFLTPISMVIADDTEAPVISSISYGPHAGVRTDPGFYLYQSCTVTDNVSVADVRINITGPVGFTSINDSMLNTNGSNYYYEIDDVSLSGTYGFFIWAIDPSNNTIQSNTYYMLVFENYLSYIYVDVNNTVGPWNGTASYPLQYIDDALAVIANNGTIFVYEGVYSNTSISITKNMSFIGENQDMTILDGGGLNNSVIIQLSGNHSFSISNFTLQNATKGLQIQNGENTTVSQCTFSQCTDSGLTMSEYQYLLVTNCTFQDNNRGIQFTNCNNNQFYHNNFLNNAIHVSSYINASNQTVRFGTTDYTTTHNSQGWIENYIDGGWYQTSVGGYADNVSALVMVSSGVVLMKACIYKGDGTLLGNTSNSSVSTGGSFVWKTFNFSTKPLLSANTYYYICIWANNYDIPSVQVAANTSGGGGFNYDQHDFNATHGTPPSPWTNTTYDSDGLVKIYCSYTAGAMGRNTAPSMSGPSRSNDNTWDNGITGNYWDNYQIIYPYANIIPETGTWDTPYLVNATGNNIDNHPWVYPSGYIDTIPPVVTVIYPNGGEEVSGNINIEWTAYDDLTTNLDGTIRIEYRVNGNSWNEIASQQNNTGVYQWDTTTVPDGDNYFIRVSATDEFLNTGSDTSDTSFSIINHWNYPPGSIQISGPSIGADGFFYNFTVTATDPEGEQIYYRWDWGDGNLSDWLGPFNSSEPLTTARAWASHGVYNITATAKDVGGASNRSAGHLISIQPLVNFSNIKLGFVYINLFTYNKSFFYSYFLERLHVVIIFTSHEMDLEAWASDMVETVAFKAEKLLTIETAEFVDNDSSDGFSCVFNVSRGVYELNVSAYDANGTLVDKYTLPTVIFLRIGRYAKGQEENPRPIQRLFSRLRH